MDSGPSHLRILFDKVEIHRFCPSTDTALEELKIEFEHKSRKENEMQPPAKISDSGQLSSILICKHLVLHDGTNQ